jgi:hypothetical protein
MPLPDNHQDAIQKTLEKTQSPLLASRWAYFSGNHPKIFITPKLRETFRGLADSLTENYCGLAITSRISRLEIQAWDGTGADSAQKIWDEGSFPQRQDVMYRWGLVHGATYLIVADDTITANAANLAYAEPDPDDWMGVAWAGKAFLEDDRWHVTLWDEDTIYRYVANDKGTIGKRKRVPSGTDFRPDEENPEEKHGYDKVPVFPIHPYGYMGAPLLDQISPIQDRINKITANKFVVAETSAFKQRVFFTRQQLDPYVVRQQPDHAIVLDPGDAEGQARVQEMTASDLSNYDNAKNAEVDALFTIASLPRHMRVNPGSTDASGEAIKADEGPFTESLHDHQREFGQAFQAALDLLGIEAEPVWRDVIVQNDLNNAQVVSQLVQAGVPWQIAAQKYLGFTPDEINEATILAGSAGVAANNAIAAQTAALLSNPTLLPPSP